VLVLVWHCYCPPEQSPHVIVIDCIFLFRYPFAGEFCDELAETYWVYVMKVYVSGWSNITCVHSFLCVADLNRVSCVCVCLSGAGAGGE
jgi:hypothetical protein